MAPVRDPLTRSAGQAAMRLLLVLVLLVLGLVLLVIAARNYIEVDEVELPSLIGMDITAASQLLADENIIAVAYPEHIRAASIDEVTSQSPPAGAVVRRGRTVSLGVHTPPTAARAPVLIGLTAEEALAQAREQNLNLGQILYAHNDVPAGIVISQSPEPGSTVDSSVGLQVTVSRGPELPPVAIPDVRGLMLEEAELRLRQLGFITISRVAAGTTRDRPGSVLNQQPVAGSVVDRSTPVYLSYGLAGDVVVQVPSLTGQFASTAQVQLRSAGLQAGSVEYVNEPGVATGAVVRTEPAAGSYTLAGAPVRLIVNGSAGTVQLGGDLPTAPEAGGGGDRELFPVGELGSRSVPFDFDPAAQGIPALMEQRYDIRIVVDDDQGERTALERNMPAGEALSTTVTVYGDALLQMYINEIFYMAWRP